MISLSNQDTKKVTDTDNWGEPYTNHELRE